MAETAGRDITESVLTKLLPHRNTRNNRDAGCWISVAPAINKDVRTWFESKNWQTKENWPLVARSIYRLLYGLVEDDDWNSLATFEGNAMLSRGIKAGFITPALHGLRPQLRILNGKTIDTVNLLLGRDAIGRDLSGYRQYLAVIDEAISDLDVKLLLDRDVFDVFCHWMCDKRLGGYARLEMVSPPNHEVEEEEESPTPTTEEEEPQTHWEAIYYIVKCGNLLGYKTYVADPSKMAFSSPLGGLASLTSVPPILGSAPQIARVDAIWYRPAPPCFLFEVEDGGTMREALHRLYNAMAFDARFFVVCPPANRDKFHKWVTTAPFKEHEARYQFRTYRELFDFYKSVLDYTSMRSHFLAVDSV